MGICSSKKSKNGGGQGSVPQSKSESTVAKKSMSVKNHSTVGPNPTTSSINESQDTVTVPFSKSSKNSIQPASLLDIDKILGEMEPKLNAAYCKRIIEELVPRQIATTAASDALDDNTLNSNSIVNMNPNSDVKDDQIIGLHKTLVRNLMNSCNGNIDVSGINKASVCRSADELVGVDATLIAAIKVLAMDKKQLSNTILVKARHNLTFGPSYNSTGGVSKHQSLTQSQIAVSIPETTSASVHDVSVVIPDERSKQTINNKQMDQYQLKFVSNPNRPQSQAMAVPENNAESQDNQNERISGDNINNDNDNAVTQPTDTVAQKTPSDDLISNLASQSQSLNESDIYHCRRVGEALIDREIESALLLNISLRVPEAKYRLEMLEDLIAQIEGQVTVNKAEGNVTLESGKDDNIQSSTTNDAAEDENANMNSQTSDNSKNKLKSDSDSPKDQLQTSASSQLLPYATDLVTFYRNKIKLQPVAAALYSMDFSLQKLQRSLGLLYSETKWKDHLPLHFTYKDPVFGVEICYDLRINYHGNRCCCWVTAGPLPIGIRQMASLISELDLLPPLIPYLEAAEDVHSWSISDRIYQTTVQPPIPWITRYINVIHQRHGFDMLSLNEKNSSVLIDTSQSHFMTADYTEAERISTTEDTNPKSKKNKAKDKDQQQPQQQYPENPNNIINPLEYFKPQNTNNSDQNSNSNSKSNSTGTGRKFQPGFVLMEYSPKPEGPLEKGGLGSSVPPQGKIPMTGGIGNKNIKLIPGKNALVTTVTKTKTQSQNGNAQDGGGGGGSGGGGGIQLGYATSGKSQSASNYSNTDNSDLKDNQQTFCPAASQSGKVTKLNEYNTDPLKTQGNHYGIVEMTESSQRREKRAKLFDGFMYRGIPIPPVSGANASRSYRVEMGTLCMIGTPIQIPNPRPPPSDSQDPSTNSSSTLNALLVRGVVEVDWSPILRGILPNSLVKAMAKSICKEVTKVGCEITRDFEKSENRKREKEDTERAYIFQTLGRRAEEQIKSKR